MGLLSRQVPGPGPPLTVGLPASSVPIDMPKFADIPKLPRAHYEVTVEWRGLERSIKESALMEGLDLDPPFQRAHVWTKAQQTAYIEYQLQGGEVGKNLTFNCPGWGGRIDIGKYVIVDGKQRLEAVRAFMRDEVPVFGHRFSEFTDSLRLTHASFNWRICTLEAEAEILRLYLNINAGGTPHTKAELDKVRRMLAKEEARK